MTKINLRDKDIEPYFQPCYVPDSVREWIQDMLDDPSNSMCRSGDDLVYNDYDKETGWQVIYIARIYAQVRAGSAKSKRNKNA